MDIKLYKQQDKPKTNIFYHGTHDTTRFGVYFMARTQQLQVRINTVDNKDSGCDPNRKFSVNKWTSLRVQVDFDSMRVYYDDNLVCFKTFKSPISHNGITSPAYFSSPFHLPSPAMVRNFQHSTLPSTFNHFFGGKH